MTQRYQHAIAILGSLDRDRLMKVLKSAQLQGHELVSMLKDFDSYVLVFKRPFPDAETKDQYISSDEAPCDSTQPATSRPSRPATYVDWLRSLPPESLTDEERFILINVHRGVLVSRPKEWRSFYEDELPNGIILYSKEPFVYYETWLKMTDSERSQHGLVL